MEEDGVGVVYKSRLESSTAEVWSLNNVHIPFSDAEPFDPSFIHPPASPRGSPSTSSLLLPLSSPCQVHLRPRPQLSHSRALPLKALLSQADAPE
ncbi:uncharacterized protein IAS62_005086 [Cryptococcus decagattii]|uniref:Uncharacterized protein n=1 Tax=Cryptococcus decagattii TaxID=1859122 RepID=A0ABZ2B4T3_9TREE